MVSLRPCSGETNILCLHAAVGFLLMAWPVLFDAGATVVELFHKGGSESSLGGLKPCSAALAPSTPDYKLQT